MRLVQIQPAKSRQTKRHNGRRFVVWVVVILMLLGGANYLRPLPSASVALKLPNIPPATAVDPGWPTRGQAAIAADGYDILGTYNDTTPMATASIAKVITALCVLEKYPLHAGESGPILTMSRDDVALYTAETERNGSSVPVYEGEQLSEYQMLQGMLIPSGNNMANSLALWAFGSLDTYAAYANAYAVRHGLTHTHIGNDASGLDASTVSTAGDLAELGQIALQNPVLMAIAGTKSVTLPYAGLLTNYNSALGHAGINGLKTGNNDQNRGGLLFTASITVAGKSVQLSGAVLGADTLSDAISSSETLVASAGANFTVLTYVQKGMIVGYAKTAWGDRTPIVTTGTLSLLHWKSLPVIERHTAHAIEAGKTTEVGAVSLQTGETEASTTLVLQHPLQPPSFWWRLSRL